MRFGGGGAILVPMNAPRLFRGFAVFALLLCASLAGCASWGSSNEESLLSAAGFRTQAPSTPKQWAFYNHLDPFSLQRDTVNGRVVYVYADKKNELVYFGGETEFQRYKALALKQSIAEENLMTSEMDEEASMNWGAWGPIGFW